jgi:hypothetical protein
MTLDSLTQSPTGAALNFNLNGGHFGSNLLHVFTQHLREYLRPLREQVVASRLPVVEPYKKSHKQDGVSNKKPNHIHPLIAVSLKVSADCYSQV